MSVVDIYVIFDNLRYEVLVLFLNLVEGEVGLCMFWVDFIVLNECVGSIFVWELFG